MKAILFALCIVFSASIAKADLPKPQQQAPQRTARESLHTSLEISTDPKAYEAKLQISESSLKELRAALDGTSGSAPIAGGLALSSTRTIMAGLLMFMAISVAGVLVARSSSFGRTQKALAALVLVAVLIGAAAIITRGNAGPPGSYRWRNLPQALAEGKATIGGVDVEIVPDSEMSGRSMRLIMPLKKQSGNGEE
jgi:hypothetical protein